ncbi:Smr/MutS family protein [Thermodesulfobacteriota bacterium]
MKKKQDRFNPAFKDLNNMVRKSRKEKESAKVKEPEVVEKVPGDELCFNEAMSDVTPVSVEGRERVPGHDRRTRPAHPAPDEVREGMAYLRDLVKGSIEMDITFSDEYVEGSVSGVNRKIMRQLKRGHIPVQDHIDLHGLTRKEAEVEVSRFLAESHKRGLRCVLLVHGRGLNSPGSFPVLKERLPVWLNRGAARKIVMAFATARPYDGGTGAIYVLLRRR